MSATRHAVPLFSLLTLTALASIGTGIFWAGMPFIAREQYGLTSMQNLLLSLASGVTYVIGARSSGRVIRAVERHLSPRAVIIWILVLQGVLSMVPIVIQSVLALCLIACGVNLLSSLLWPVVESYLTAGRHGHAMRSAIGWFNLVWTLAVAVAIVGMSPFMPDAGSTSTSGVRPDQTIIVTGILIWIATMPTRWFPSSPGAHGEPAEGDVPLVYVDLLRSARTLLPLSYVMAAGMAPLMPYRTEALGLTPAMGPPAAALWMIARPVAMTLMWRLGAWHGRWNTLTFAFVAMITGFALVVAGQNLALFIIGQCIFGAGMGAVYFAALYYAMAVGSAAVDAGGTHEALIGLGYSVGPLCVMLGLMLGARTPDASWLPASWTSNAWIVIVMWIVIILGGMHALGPFLRARRRARRAH